MRRLVYTPKVECLIMRTDEGGREIELLDVTTDIVNGSVMRRLNAVSELQLTLQNKHARYTKNNIIKPMDRIIVRMSRVGKPFLVFSGFVDDAPLFQLYPGTVTLSASCTLKLLQNTMFDPGVLFIRHWFAQHGWSYDPDSGSLYVGTAGVGNDDVYGTAGDILAALLTEIGNWPEGAISIYGLPESFLASIALVMQDASDTGAQIYKDNAAILAKLYGTADITPSGGGGGSSLEGDTASLPSTGNIDIVDVARLALKAGFAGDSAIIAVAVAQAESGLNTQAMNFNLDGSYDSGLWQINSVHTSGGTGLAMPPGGTGTLNMPGAWNTVKGSIPTSVRNYIEAQWKPTTNAASAYSISSNGTSFIPWSTYNNGDYKTNDYMTKAADAVKKAKLTPTVPISVSNSSASTTTSNTSTSTAAANESPQRAATAKWVQPNGSESMVTGNASPYSNIKIEPHADWIHVIPLLLSTINTLCKQHNVTATITSGYRDINYNNSIGGASGSAHTVGLALDADVNGVPICDSVIAGGLSAAGVRLGSTFNWPTMGGPDTVHVDFYDPATLSMNTTAQAWVKAGGTGTYVGTDPGSGTTGSTDLGTYSKEDIMRLGGAAGFYTQQFQNSDFTLSSVLTGRRALANDISLLEWIDNLVPSSGRVYTSAPSGNFLSFFPDRWGFFERTPYFFITDTEIIDLSINENDSNLTTHVFTSGPQIPTSGIQVYDRLNSMVASVEEDAFKYFVHPSKDFSPVQFLKKYGARVYVNDVMNVNNPLLLWMHGWMKFMELWAKRFTANASFTFMPELFPGGRVSLGDRVEMFIESVTHTFDLSSGFSTSAELSSIVDQTGSIDDMIDPIQGFGPQVQQTIESNHAE